MSEETSASASASPAPVNRQPPRRIKLTDDLLESITREDLVKNWRENELYFNFLESQTTTQEAELVHLRECEERIRQQHAESTHREKILVRRLATKEQEMQEYVSQIAELKSDKAPGAAALRSALLDPAVNLLLQRLRQELISTKARLDETQNELSAWKFTPDSNTGKRLMAKCRLLYQENEELGRIISSGRLAKLEGDLALQKNFSDEVKKSQSELDEFLQDLDEDVEGMQSTIYYLQQELRKAKEAIGNLQQENELLKNGPQEESETTNPSALVNAELETKPTVSEDTEPKPVPPVMRSPIPPDTTESTEETASELRPEPREKLVEMDESANLNAPTPPPAVEATNQRDWGSSSDSNELILEADPIVDDIENDEQNEVKVEDSPTRKRSFESVDNDNENAPLTKKARRDSELSLHYTGDEDLGHEENNEVVLRKKSPERKISDDDDGSDDTPLSHIRRDSL